MKSLPAAALLAAFAAPALAAEPYIGTWGQDAATCKGDPLFTIEAGKFTGATFACGKASFAKDGARWKARLQQCTDDEGSAVDLAAALEVKDGKLQVLWSDGSKSGRLARCR